MGPRFDPSPVAGLPVTWTNVLTGVLLASGIQGFVDWSVTLLVLSAATLLHLGDVRSPRDWTDDSSFVSGRGFLLIGIGTAVAWMIRPACGIVAMVFAVIMILDDLRGRRGLTGILAFATRRTILYALGFAAAIAQPLDAVLGGGGAEFLIACLLLTVIHIHFVAVGFVAWGRFDPTSPTCPECRYQVFEDQSICPECGSPCGPEVRAEPVRVTQGRYRGMPQRVAYVLLIPFLGCRRLARLLPATPPTGLDRSRALYALIVSALTFAVLGIALRRAIHDLADLPDRLQRFVIRFVAALAIFDAGLTALTEARLGAVALGGAVFCIAAMFVTDRWWSRQVPAPRSP
ncbi:MAG: hypothetical protein GY728_15175 [Phycisphaeraceae bacterium]|nr:hypothetical protein [Phycisphaeraceae bacterium]